MLFGIYIVCSSLIAFSLTVAFQHGVLWPRAFVTLLKQLFHRLNLLMTPATDVMVSTENTECGICIRSYHDYSLC